MLRARLPLTREVQGSSVARASRSSVNVRTCSGCVPCGVGMAAAAQRRHSTRLCTRCRAAPVPLWS